MTKYVLTRLAYEWIYRDGNSVSNHLKAGSKLFPATLEVRGRRSKACLVACARSFLARIHPSDPPCRALTPALCPL